MIRGGMSTYKIIKALNKGGYSVEISGSDENKFIWEVVDNHVVYIGIMGFNFNYFDEDEEGGG